MKHQIECAFCDGQAYITTNPKILVYRNETFNIKQHFYKCTKCLEEFTNTETDEASLKQAWHQYRAKHHIPFPDEISENREQYGFSAAKMSELLGMGINQYSLYEKGEIPSPSNANLIRIAAKPHIFLEFIESGEFSEDVDVKSKIIRLFQRNTQMPIINIEKDANSLTGFRRTNWQRIAKLLLYIIEKSEPRYNTPLKLNKVLFYIDFLVFKHTSRSATGITYRAIEYGPVPTYYDNIYRCLITEELATNELIKNKENPYLALCNLEKGSIEMFDKEERMIIEKVIEKTQKMPTSIIVNKSHEEKLWQELYKNKAIINYLEYGYDMNENILS